MTRIVIADDHAIVREGLKRIIMPAAGLEVVAEAVDGNEVLRLIDTIDFEVLVMDLSMPGSSGVDLIKAVRAARPAVRILVLSMHEEMQYAVRAIKAGASGYLTKGSAPARLVEAIGKIAAGGAFISAEVAQQLALGSMPGAAIGSHETLSPRELEVMCLLARGESVTSISTQLNLSVKTVSTHKSNLMQKMGMRNPSELFRYAIKHGLVDESGA